MSTDVVLWWLGMSCGSFPVHAGEVGAGHRPACCCKADRPHSSGRCCVDEQEQKQSGKLYKHYIFTDLVEGSKTGARVIAACMLAYGYKMIYTKASLAKKERARATVFANSQRACEADLGADANHLTKGEQANC